MGHPIQTDFIAYCLTRPGKDFAKILLTELLKTLAMYYKHNNNSK